MDVAAAIREGYTLPGAWYTDDSVFAEERRRIFHRTWQYAGPAAAVAEPGDFLTHRTGAVPLVVVRDTDGALNAFVNVCRHRGAEVVLAERGNRKTLQCHYHAWTYGLDGCLRAAPGEKEQVDFDRSEFSLVRVQAETWGPFLFVNPVAGAPPLAETLGELPAIVNASGLDFDGLQLRETAEYDTAANWKAIVDNQLECYHCPVAHPAFAALVDTDDYTTEEFPTFTVQRGRVRDSARGGDGPYRISAGVDESFYVFLWPNFALNVYPGPGNVSVNVFLPLEPGRTLARYHYYFADAVSDDDLAEFVGFIDQVQREDIVLVESVQRGLGSGFYDRGKLFAGREDALRYFQRLVAGALATGRR
ncbi:MAG: aromatic ring-hydroxylating dioxygenase subunit alpha [Actinobacteria bacterium]|nr:aromatic ring-hydroxylating dioxygenase subunit alpha [Actinomycetota bacterium]